MSQYGSDNPSSSKTMDPRFRYILNYFRRVYNVPAEVDIGHGTHDRKINIGKGDLTYFDRFAESHPKRVVWKQWNGVSIPFLFDDNDEKDLFEIKNNRATIHYDILASSFYFLSGWQEHVYLQQKNAVRFSFQESIQKKLDIAGLPVVNYYFDILRDVIQKTYRIDLTMNCWDGYDFAVCLTHDVDKCRTGWIEESLHLLKRGRFLIPFRLLKEHIRNQDIWFNFEEILALEKNHDVQSSFYFMSRKGKGLRKLWDADYDIRDPDFRSVFSSVREAGSEIGIHGSFGTHRNAELLKEDIETLSAPVAGGRFHYLCFDPAISFNVMENAGLGYDSTQGFAEEIGFRNGIVYPFLPYNIHQNRPHNILEIPLMVMDVSLKKMKNRAMDDKLSDVLELIREVRKWHGCLTLLWHNNYFSTYKYAGWREFYIKLIEEAKKMNGLFLTAEQVYRRWPAMDKS